MKQIANIFLRFCGLIALAFAGLAMMPLFFIIALLDKEEK